MRQTHNLPLTYDYITTIFALHTQGNNAQCPISASPTTHKQTTPAKRKETNKPGQTDPTTCHAALTADDAKATKRPHQYVWGWCTMVDATLGRERNRTSAPASQFYEPELLSLGN